MPPHEDELQHRVALQAVESYVDLYKDLAQTWKSLDAKAQGTAAIAGIFIAGAFAFIRDAQPTLTGPEALLMAALVLLALCILFSVAAMWVRTVDYPPFGPELSQMVDDLLRRSSPADLSVRVAALYADRRGLWKRTPLMYNDTSL